jgi:hypothetical protein
MKQALQILGYHDCYHFYNIYQNVSDCDMWIEALEAKYHGKGKFGRAEFDKLLGHCMAVTDAPCTAFAPELIDAYPEAKVILVERDIEAWYRSFQHILDPIFRTDFWIASILDPYWMGKLYRMTILWIEGHFGATTLAKGQENCRRVYQEHSAEIRRVTPKERLLEYQLGSGWEPLCKFLGKEVPNMPFPNVNEADVLRAKMDVLGKKSMGRGLKNLAMVMTASVAIGYAVFRTFSSSV